MSSILIEIIQFGLLLYYFSQGSVIVNFEINFIREYTETEIVKLVQTAFYSGVKSQRGDNALLGDLNVQISSLEVNGKTVYFNFKFDH